MSKRICFQCVYYWGDFEPIEGTVALPPVWIGGSNSLELLEDIRMISGCHKDIFKEGFDDRISFPTNCNGFESKIGDRECVA